MWANLAETGQAEAAPGVAQAACQRTHLLGLQFLRRPGGVLQSSDEEVLQRLDILGVDDLRIDAHGPHLTGGGARDLHQTVAGLTDDLGRGELGLGGHQLLLHLLRLLQDHLHVGLTRLHQRSPRTSSLRRRGRLPRQAIACEAGHVRTSCSALLAAAVLTATACGGASAATRPATASGPRAADPPPVVVLDPGHNGRNAEEPAAVRRPVPDGRGGTKACNTTGTATDADYPEHAFAFDVATRVAQRLTAAGVRVVLTRQDDDGVGPCVDERGKAGETADADAVVSIHADGAAATASGFHVAYSEPPLNPVQAGPARELATALRDALRAAGLPDADYIGHDGLSARSDLAGLNHATRPTVLVECANMRNPAEAALVSSPEGRDRYAAMITAGVLAYLEPPVQEGQGR
jgi:N-acetylmuramoyl-L-alanine amidase